MNRVSSNHSIKKSSSEIKKEGDFLFSYEILSELFACRLLPVGSCTAARRRFLLFEAGDRCHDCQWGETPSRQHDLRTSDTPLRNDSSREESRQRARGGGASNRSRTFRKRAHHRPVVGSGERTGNPLTGNSPSGGQRHRRRGGLSDESSLQTQQEVSEGQFGEV